MRIEICAVTNIYSGIHFLDACVVFFEGDELSSHTHEIEQIKREQMA